jgi:hypothetical protein
MRSPYEAFSTEQAEIERKGLQGTARICSSPFGAAWKGVFPIKSAEELAARTGHSVRTAAYQLSGEHPPSDLSILALIQAVVPRRR